MKPVPEKCEGCDERPPVCRSRVGRRAFFVRPDGSTYHRPTAWAYFCGECCDHGGEEGSCYDLRTGEKND